jgi:hypothetical protein
MPRFDPVKGLSFINVKAKPVDRIDMEEQSKYKYIIHIDGNVAAYRLLKTMLLGSVILKVQGKYLLWIEQLLEDGVNYISIKPDMSDLIEKIEWCNSHDAECKIIAENGAKLAQKILNKDYIDNSFVKILLDVKNTITSRNRSIGTPDLPPNVPKPFSPHSPDYPHPANQPYPPPSPDYPPPSPNYPPPSPDYSPPANQAYSPISIIGQTVKQLTSSILEVPKEPESNDKESPKNNEDSSSSEDNKKVIETSSDSSSEKSNSSQTKKIII